MTSTGQNIGDRALTHPDADRLGYAPFAEHVAAALSNADYSQGLVIAVNGEWGLGKSTVLNFVEHYLTPGDDGESLQIVRFNPWWYSSSDALLHALLGQLRQAFKGWRGKRGNVEKWLTQLSDVLAVSSLEDGRLAAWAIKRLLRADLESTKRKIEATLRDQKQRIVVLVDDIDRLTGAEVAELFRVIKSVADLPYVAYVLSFDRSVVCDVLSRHLSVDGDAFLEKIVQLPFTLPIPAETDLADLFSEKLNNALGEVEADEERQLRFGNTFHESIKHFLSTPRDVIRLTNVIGATHAAVDAHVDWVDFVGIETLRVFEPAIYNAIARAPDLVTGLESLHGRENEPRLRNITELANKPERAEVAAVKRLLRRLFPRLDSTWENTTYDDSHLDEWRRSGRVCSPECFPLYFQLSLPAGAFSEQEVRDVLEALYTPTSFAQRLIDLTAQQSAGRRTRLPEFLERALSYVADDALSDDQRQSLIIVLLDIGDRLLVEVDEEPSLFGEGNGMRVARLAYWTLRALPPDKRVTILRDAIAGGEALATMSRVMGILGQEHGKYQGGATTPEKEPLLTLEEQEELEQLVLNRIRTYSQGYRLLEVPRLPNILYRWRDWSNLDEPRNWVAKVITEPERLPRLLEPFVTVSYSQYVDDAVGKRKVSLDWDALKEFSEMKVLIESANQIPSSQRLTKNQALAVDLLKHWPTSINGI